MIKEKRGVAHKLSVINLNELELCALKTVLRYREGASVSSVIRMLIKEEALRIDPAYELEISELKEDCI